MIKNRYVLPVLLIGMLLPAFAHSLEVVPFWVRDGWRAKNYSSNEWYTCFHQQKSEHKSEELLKQLEKDVKREISDSIFSTISSKGKADYRQMIETAIKSGNIQVQNHSYYHHANETTYAFAAVKITDFFSYFESQIKQGLNEAINAYEQGKQLAEQGRKREAFDKFTESKKQVEKLSVYKELLAALDSEEGPKYSQIDNSKMLLRSIAEAESETQKINPVYINGSERISGDDPGIIIPGLYNNFDMNGCRTTDDIRDAGYHVRVDVKTCSTKKLMDEYHCQACVSANITNNKTKANMQKINFNSQMATGYELESACESAFEMALSELWNRISEKVLQRICD